MNRGRPGGLSVKHAGGASAEAGGGGAVRSVRARARVRVRVRACLRTQGSGPCPVCGIWLENDPVFCGNASSGP